MANLACTLFGVNCPAPPENRIKLLNETIANTILRNIKECENTLNLGQVVSMKCIPSPAVEIARSNSAACTLQTQEMAKRGIFKPAPLCFACVQSDIIQSALMSFSQNCNNKNINTNKLQTQIKDQLMQVATKEVSGIGGLLEQATANNLLEKANKVASGFTAENITKTITKLAQNQEVTMEGSGGLQTAISQTSALTLIIDSMTKNESHNSTVSDFSTELSQSLKLSQKGFFGAFADIFKYGVIAIAILAGARILFSLMVKNNQKKMNGDTMTLENTSSAVESVDPVVAALSAILRQKKRKI